MKIKIYISILIVNSIKCELEFRSTDDGESVKLVLPTYGLSLSPNWKFKLKMQKKTSGILWIQTHSLNWPALNKQI